MEKRTNLFSLAILVVALNLLEILQVVFELFPAVAILTKHALGTALNIALDFFFTIPVGTRNKFLFSKKRPFEILPVVGIDTSESIMLQFRKRTKFRLELEEKEIFVHRQ